MRYRGREGMWTWVLHRATGLGILFFLIIHVVDTATGDLVAGQVRRCAGTLSAPVLPPGASSMIIFSVLYPRGERAAHHRAGLLALGDASISGSWCSPTAVIVVVLAMLPCHLDHARADLVGLADEPGVGAPRGLRCAVEPDAGALHRTASGTRRRGGGGHDESRWHRNAAHAAFGRLTTRSDAACRATRPSSPASAAVAAQGWRLPPAGSATRSNFEVFSWFFMRITGLRAHLPRALPPGLVEPVHRRRAPGRGRWSSLVGRNPFWRLFNVMLITFAMLHGLNGARYSIEDYVRKPGAQLAVKAVVYTVVLGALTSRAFRALFTFRSGRARSLDDPYPHHTIPSSSAAGGAGADVGACTSPGILG